MRLWVIDSPSMREPMLFPGTFAEAITRARIMVAQYHYKRPMVRLARLDDLPMVRLARLDDLLRVA